MGHVKGFSLGAQNPSPHLVHLPQSTWHVAQLSPTCVLHTPLPQKPQSIGQETGVSPKVQAPSPHRGAVRQSIGHVNIDSPGPQKPSPQKLIGPQSDGHVPNGPASPGSQKRFPQTGTRQSLGHVIVFSPGSHTRLPQKNPQSRGHV
jgi:hypothetical protein